jgi:AdoMet-dependent rRNA methyltransferase SPB1
MGVAFRRYDALMDEYLEESYKQYQERRGQNKDTGRKKKRRRVGDEEDGEMGEDAGGGEELAGNRYDSSDEEDNELLVSLDKGKKGEAGSEGDVASQWFSQDVFQSLEDMDEETAAPFGAKKGAKKAAKGVPKGKKPAAKRSKVDDVSGAGGEKGAGLKAPSPAEGVADEEDSDFEVVPQAPSDDESNSDSDDEFDYMSDDAKAEILAIAKKMMKRKVKDNIVEAAYNRFAFHDEGLPKWFEADEFRHMRPNPILSKSELDAERDRMKAIDSRPIKKVAEAKARKRKRTAVRLDKARSKATVIAGNEDMPSSAKLREIEKLYAQAKNTGYKAKGKKKPTRMERQKSSGPPKDGRLRADQARGKKAQKMKKAAKGGKGKGGKR